MFVCSLLLTTFVIGSASDSMFRKYPEEYPDSNESWLAWAKRQSCQRTNYILTDFECCIAPYVRRKTAVSNLRKTLNREFYGQHLAVEATLDSLDAHLNSNLRTPLVLSFHGWHGSGKSFLTELLAEALYRNGVNSRFYRLFRLGHEFPFLRKDELRQHWSQFAEKLLQTGKRCEHTMFVFEEVDDVIPEILDNLVPYIDYPFTVDGVSFQNAIFIFLSNAGGSEINDIVLDAWKSGKKRESLTSDDFDEMLIVKSYNKVGGLQESRLIKKGLLTFIPFLPMEIAHIRQCIAHQVTLQNAEIDKVQLEKMAEKMCNWPRETPAFASFGCKGVDHIVSKLLVRNRPQIQREDL